MKKRIVIGALLIAVLGGVYALDAYVLKGVLVTRLVIWLVALGTLHEVLVLGAKRINCDKGLLALAAIAVGAIVIPYLVMGLDVPLAVPGTLLALAAIVAGGIRLIGMAPLRSAPAAFPEAVLLAGAILYAAGLLSCLDRLFVRGGLGTGVAVIAISKTTDICGYFVGTLVGRRRIVPALSPKKTWEGTIAGVLGAAGMGALLAPELIGTPVFCAAVGAVLGACSFLGDLLGSGIKRWAGVKDSGALLPEFGGVLDLVDGILVAAPVAAVCLYGA
jgi:phosphatidate cytidylyltransferase